MTKQNNRDKNDLVSITLLAAEQDSGDIEAARQFLQSNGIDTANFVTNGLKKIKQLHLQANAKRTEEAMKAAEKIKQEAIAWVDQMLGSVNFSLPQLVEAEQLSMSFRNIETLDDEDIRAILIKHFTLKFINQQDKGTP